MGLEIERKFFVKTVPFDVLIVSEQTIFQNYLAVGNEELRLRAVATDKGLHYFITFKQGKCRVRGEWEASISEETYLQLIKAGGEPLIKTRYKLNDKGLLVELDSYHHSFVHPDRGKICTLMTVEVEFLGLEEAEKFRVPYWFGEEVTNDPFFKSQSLWKAVQAKAGVA